MSIVLQKYIADSGMCARRKAEELIRLGQVKVNGKRAELGQRVEMTDEVIVSGRKIKTATHKVYLKLNKPVGYVSTNATKRGEKPVFELIKTSERLFVVGRLDKDSRGLMILTNDGELAQQLAHPSFEHEKKYIVKVSQGRSKAEHALPFKLTDAVLRHFLTGIDIGEGDGVVRAKSIKYLRTNTFEIVLTYGKKRQIRRMFAAFELLVMDLQRIEIAGLKLGALKERESKALTAQEVAMLKTRKEMQFSQTAPVQEVDVEQDE